MKNMWLRFVREEEGQDLIEYALLGGFISLVAVAGATILGGALNTWYTNVGGTVNGMATGS